MDETYIKVPGQWVYLYCARRQSRPNGRFLAQPEPGRKRRQIVSAQGDEEHSRADEDHVGRLCSLAPGGARDEGRWRTSGSCQGSIQPVLNNLVGQDHQRVKQRIRPMLGFKRFDNAAVTISGIELAEKIKKGQFQTGKLGGCNVTMTELWNAGLAA